MIKLSQRGDFNNTERFLKKSLRDDWLYIVDNYGSQGVKALAAATPVNTGLTASSWSYDITKNSKSITLSFKNSNVNKGVNIAIILQYGHATRNGGYVQGKDYINPVLRPLFDKLAEQAWKEVTRV